MDDIFTYLARKYNPSLLRPCCQKAHPRLILAGTVKGYGDSLRWGKRCGNTAFTVASKGDKVKKGTLWFDTTNRKLKYYDGKKWRVIRLVWYKRLYDWLKLKSIKIKGWLK